jgi:hypothetical protein
MQQRMCACTMWTTAAQMTSRLGALTTAAQVSRHDDLLLAGVGLFCYVALTWHSSHVLLLSWSAAEGIWDPVCKLIVQGCCLTCSCIHVLLLLLLSCCAAEILGTLSASRC